MSTLRTLGAAALIAPLILVAPPATYAGSQPAQLTRVIADCVHPTVEPRQVFAACGDANEWAVIKRYGSWRTNQAWGSGRLFRNDCDPTCADGTVRSYRATFRFHRVVETRRGPLFTRLGVTYMQGGEEHDVELTLPRRPI
jgi:hypothetical protein